MAVNQTPWEGSKVHCQGGTKQYAKYLRSSGGHTEVCVFHDLARGNLTTCRNKQCAVEQHHDDGDDYEGVSKMVGLVLNGVLLFLSLVMIVMGGLGAAKAADACPGAADCVPASVTMLVLLGVATMVVSSLIVFGANSGNGMLITVGTLILIFPAILMVLFALILHVHRRRDGRDDLLLRHTVPQAPLRAGDNIYFIE